MKESKMQLINKIFNNETIRTVWDKEDEKYYISIVDIVGVLANSKEPRKYWNWLKNRLLKEENFETSSITRQLKLKATDGKYRITDVTDIEVILTDLGEVTARDIAKQERPQGLKDNLKVAKRGGDVSKIARESYELETGNSAITSENVIGGRYVNTNKQLKQK